MTDVWISAATLVGVLLVLFVRCAVPDVAARIRAIRDGRDLDAELDAELWPIVQAALNEDENRLLLAPDNAGRVS